MKVPTLRAALTSTAHPDHAAVQGYLALANHFAVNHPQKPDGAPADWTEPLSPAMRSFILGERPAIAATDLSPTEAQAFLSYTETRGDLMAAHRDKGAPGHATIVDEYVALHARAAATAPTDTTMETQPMRRDAATQSRIDELTAKLRDPKLPGGSEDRQQVITELATLLAQAPTAPATSSAPSGSSTAASGGAPGASATPTSRIAELTAKLRDPKLPGGSEDRQQTVAELGTLLAEAPADPAA
jgi:hypothetical protein